jgi:hypothetical protein
MAGCSIKSYRRVLDKNLKIVEANAKHYLYYGEHMPVADRRAYRPYFLGICGRGN